MYIPSKSVNIIVATLVADIEKSQRLAECQTNRKMTCNPSANTVSCLRSHATILVADKEFMTLIFCCEPDNEKQQNLKC